jgi:acetyl esterase
MPLDPQVSTLLDQMEAQAGPSINQMTPEDARTMMRTLGTLAKYPDERAPAHDRRIPGPAGEIPIRVYTPAASEPLPVVVFFHGGGWVIGDIETHDATCQQIATSVPAVFVSVDYRLAPEHRFPAALEDCLAATRWVGAHAGELGADGAHLAVAGDSAGGNLAALVALQARNQGGPPIVFQLLVYPATDLTCSFPSHVENGEGYLLTSESIRWFLDHYISEPERKGSDASPHFADDLSRLPPALIITAEFDPLRDEGEAYAARLKEAGVPVTLTRYDGMIHGFFGMELVVDGAARAVQQAAGALRQALYASPS